MSLIRCPECKQPMSDTLSVCPHCGYNLTDKDKVDAYGDAILNPVDMEAPKAAPIKEKVKKEIPDYIESEATVKINGKTYVDGHLKMHKGMFYFKRGDNYWTHTRYYFPSEWEEFLNVKAIKALRYTKVKDWGAGDSTVDAFVIKTKSGTIIYMTPVDHKRFNEYFEANNIPYLTDEELNLPKEKIGYNMDHNEKVGIIIIFSIIGLIILVAILFGIFVNSD